MRSKWMAVAIITAASIGLGADVLSFWFTGIDTFPLLLSSQATSTLDLLHLFGRQFLSAYADQQIAGSVGVRPIPMLLFAIEQWISNLNPFGYHLTNLLLHTFNAILVFLLSQQLRLRHATVVGLVAALIFLVNPLQARVLAAIPVRFELMMCTFVLLALISLLRYLDSDNRNWLVGSLLCTAMALLSKESAVLLAPMMAWTIVTVVANQRNRSILHVVLPLAGLALVTLIYLIYRYWVVSGVGGYPLQEVTLGNAVFSVRYVPVFFFRMLMMPTAMTFLDGWGKVGVIVWTILGWSFLLALLATMIATLRSMFSTWRWIPIPRKFGSGFDSDALPVHLLTAWVLVHVPFYALLHLSTRVIQTWYAYVPMAFFSVILGVLVVRGWNLLRRSGSGKTSIARSGSTVLAAALPSVIMGLYLVSPGSGRFCEWPEASRIARAYLENMDRLLQRVPDGATVFMVNLPHGVENPTDRCAVGELPGAVIFEDYSLDSWLRLTRPERTIEFIALTTVWIDVYNQLESSISFDAEQRTISVINTSGRMEPPWVSSAAEHFTTEFDDSGSRLTIRRLREETPAKDQYIVDVFEPRVLFRFTAGGTLEPV